MIIAIFHNTQFFTLQDLHVQEPKSTGAPNERNIVNPGYLQRENCFVAVINCKRFRPSIVEKMKAAVRKLVGIVFIFVKYSILDLCEWLLFRIIWNFCKATPVTYSLISNVIMNAMVWHSISHALITFHCFRPALVASSLLSTRARYLCMRSS